MGTLNIERNQLINETDLLEMQVRNSGDNDQIKEEEVSTEEQMKDLYDDFTVTTDNKVFDTFPVDTTLNDEKSKKSNELISLKDSLKCPFCSDLFSIKKFLMKHVLAKHGNSAGTYVCRFCKTYVTENFEHLNTHLRKCQEKERSEMALKPLTSNFPENAYFEVNVGGNSGIESEKEVLQLEEKHVLNKPAPQKLKDSVTVEETSRKREEKIEKPKPKPKVIEVGPNGIKYQNLDPSIFGSHTKVPKVLSQEKPKAELKEPPKQKNESVKCPECGFQVGHKILLKNHIESRHYKLYSQNTFIANHDSKIPIMKYVNMYVWSFFILDVKIKYEIKDLSEH